MNKQYQFEQLGLGLEEAGDALPLTVVPPKKTPTRKSVAQTAPSPELCAEILSAHPDYRVLRRLPEQRYWGELPEDRSRLLQVLVVDTETTGLDVRADHLLEVALLRFQVDLDTGQPVGEVEVYDGLQDPGVEIPPAVTRITGLRQEDVAGQQLDEARITALAQGVDLVIAHNAAFDRPFLERRLPLFADLPWVCSLVDVPWKQLGPRSAKLEDIALHGGWFYAAHRAETDCHALLRVLADTSVAEPAHQSALVAVCACRLQTYYTVYALQAPFAAKELLRQRGYRWNAEEKCWCCEVSTDALLKLEMDWLKTQVYGASASIGIETRTPKQRFSLTAGQVTRAWL